MHRLSDRSFFCLALIGALGLTLALAGCGRKGPLDAPPAALTDQHPAGGAMAEKPKDEANTPQKHFVLDPLLN
jgi:predicted small lipoprotein YifL